MCHHRRIRNEAKMIARQIAVQVVNQGPAEAFGSAMIAQESTKPDVVVPTGNLERDVAERRTYGLDLFDERAHVGRATMGEMKATHVARHRCQSALIVEFPGEGFSFPEILFDSSPFHERNQSVSKVKAKIDGLLYGLARLGYVDQRRQRFLETPNSFAMGRAAEGLSTGLLKVGDRLRPVLSQERMVRQPVNLLGQPTRIHSLDCLHDSHVEAAPPVLE